MPIEAFRQQMQAVAVETDAIAANIDPQFQPLIQAAQARLAEATAFMAIAAECQENADPRLARLDTVIRETTQMVVQVIERAGVDLHDGIGIDEVDEFLIRQEQASAALDHARICATATVVHLDRALKLSFRG